MKIIFLDVDGVLNCRDTFSGPHADGHFTLDPDMCDRFKEIVDSCWPITPIVVLSSTWRLFEENRTKVTNWLLERGITIHSQTPKIRRDSEMIMRGEEINKWFADRPQLNVSKFIILDDDSDFTQEQKPFHVHTSFQDGLTWEKTQEAIRKLKN